MLFAGDHPSVILCVLHSRWIQKELDIFQSSASFGEGGTLHSIFEIVYNRSLESSWKMHRVEKTVWF